MNGQSERNIEQILSEYGEQIRSHTSLTDSVLSRLASLGAVTECDEKKATINSSSDITSFKPRESKVFKHLSIAAAILIIASVVGTFFVMASQTSIAQVIENIKVATSYSADFRFVVPEGDGLKKRMSGKIYWQQPGMYRFDETKDPDSETPLRSRRISSTNARGIEIGLTDRTFKRTPPFKGASSPLLNFQQLTHFSDNSSESLGNKKIQGRPCSGFKFATNKVDPSSGTGSVSLWVDDHTGLPAVVEISIRNRGADETMVFDNFHWDKKLDSALFSTKAPEGFTEIQQPKVDHDRDLKAMVKALRLYAKVTGGKYPKVKIIYGDVIREELHNLDADDKYIEGNFGWATMSVIMRQKESSYHGIEVDQNSPDKVLFRWKRDDGKVQVIYGNLESAIEEG